MSIKLLKKLGLSTHTFSEVIVAMKSKHDYYAAPIGVKLINRKITAWIYKGSRLFEELSQANYCSLNVTSNPKIFYNALFKKDIHFGIFHRTGTPYIKDADAIIEAYISKNEDLNEKSIFTFKPLLIKFKKVYPKTFNRAEPAIIEALIHFTRVKVYYRIGDSAKVKELMNRIVACIDTVKHSTLDPELNKIAMNILIKAQEAIKS